MFITLSTLKFTAASGLIRALALVGAHQAPASKPKVTLAFLGVGTAAGLLYDYKKAQLNVYAEDRLQFLEKLRTEVVIPDQEKRWEEAAKYRSEVKV